MSPKCAATAIGRELFGPDVEFRQTHISWVFLKGDEAWKIKKPVSLGFLDFSDIESRLRACRAEVRLNRRLAPDVYLDVVPVTLDESGRHRLGGPGTPIDWAVRMRRLPDSHSAQALLREGRLQPRHIDLIAQRLAAFHRQATCDEETSRFGQVEMIAVNVKENFDQTRNSIGRYLSPQQAAEIEEWQTGFLEANRDLLQARVEGGCIREGHGDLRLEHVYLSPAGGEGPEELRIIDCIEFNQRFRVADVCADIAFLSMDLAWSGRCDLAEGLLASYAQASNDFDIYSVVDFYQGYRAFVRGKISAFLAADPQADDRVRRANEEEARRYFLLALASERCPLQQPALIAVGGLIASGKTTLSRWLSWQVPGPIVSTDRTRKFLLGLDALRALPERPFAGAYSPRFSDRVYREAMRRADSVLSSGRAVIIDASFSRRKEREAACRLADKHSVPFLFIECRTSPELVLERLRQRAQSPSVSDGRREIYQEFASRWEPAEEIPCGKKLVLDTSRPWEECIDLLRGRLQPWPSALN